MGYYWKIKKQHIKFLPKDKFSDDQRRGWVRHDDFFIDDLMYASYNCSMNGWMLYNEKSRKWFHNNGYKYMGDFKTPNDIRKEKIKRLKI